MIEDFINIEETVSKSLDIISPNEYFPDVIVSKDICDPDELENLASWAVENFLERDPYREITYSDAGFDLRKDYMVDFHNNFNRMSGYSHNLRFSDDFVSNEWGAFDVETKEIVLNSNLLVDSNPEKVMKTILHETRHAYQYFAINYPDKVYIDDDTLKAWKDNFKHYISPELDYEAYRNQPLEKDAEDFANRMWNEGVAHAA